MVLVPGIITGYSFTLCFMLFWLLTNSKLTPICWYFRNNEQGFDALIVCQNRIQVCTDKGYVEMQ